MKSDRLIKVEALRRACEIQNNNCPVDSVKSAKVFEKYLRGGK